MSQWRRRLDQEPDSPPSLPLRPGNLSNGEYVPLPPTRRDRLLARAVLDRAAVAADRAGVDRRRFLHSAAGLAAVLSTYNLYGCSAGDGRSSSTGSTASTRRASTTPPSTVGASTTGPGTTTTAATMPSTTGPGGTFDVPEPEDVAACAEALAGSEFIFDVHTHHVVPDGPWRANAPRIADMISGLVPEGCLEDDPFVCLDRISYLNDLFLASDTTVALLSDVPNSGDDDAPVPFLGKVATRELASRLAAGGAPRVLVHDVIAPNFGDLAARLDGMAATVASGHVAAFKVYTAWGPDGQGFGLDDPALGLPVIERAHDLGVRIMCAHKGLPLLEFDRRFNGPEDLVAVAANYPDMNFVVYHSAYERQTYEGPFDPADAATGVNSLLKAMDDTGLPPNSNVWAELGTTWREVLDDPTQAAHTVGKLLSRMGEDRVMWGTDAIWLGSPQPQIMAFRAFQISPEFQERFGYPALTDEIKAKVFGLNAARLFGLDPHAARCAVDADRLTASRDEHAALVREGALPFPWQARGPVTRREVLAWLTSARTPWTP